MLTSHAVDDSDDNGGNDELMRFDWIACLSTVTTASTPTLTTLTHGVSTLRDKCFPWRIRGLSCTTGPLG